jgi:ABC-type antimicrobial peptide transport system permease subunit
VLLAAIGLYGVMAAAVGDRAREIAVRLALGATPRRVVRMVLGQTLAVACAGVALGVLVALAATRALEPLLFDVSRFDPAIYIAMAGLLVLVAVVSGYLPARRITRVDPVTTLRAQ